MYSKSAQYGIRAILYIAKNQKQWENIGLPEISNRVGIPYHFLSKILQILVKAKILRSTKGPHGGFELVNYKSLTLLKVVNAIDDPNKHMECLCGNCSRKNPCDIRRHYVEINEAINVVLNQKLSKMVGV